MKNLPPTKNIKFYILLIFLAGCGQRPIIIPITSTTEFLATEVNITSMPQETQVLTSTVTSTIEPTATNTATIIPSTETLTPTTISPTETLTPTTSELLFQEEFHDNSNGWTLNSSDRFSNDRLAVTLGRGEWRWITLPTVKVDGDYYIRAEMTLAEGRSCSSAMGFAVGEAPISNNSFLFSGGSCTGEKIGFFEDNIPLFNTPLNGLVFNRGTSYIIELEVKSGFYTFSVGGNEESSSITPKGNDIGIYLWRFNEIFVPAESTFFIDNVILKKE